MKDNNFKIIVLTNKGSLYGKMILNDLLYSKIGVEAAVVVTQPFKHYQKLFKYIHKKVGFIDAVYFSIKRLLDHKKEPSYWNGYRFISDYSEMDIQVFFTKGTNSEYTLNILKEISPDLLILGQTGIIRKKLIEIPKIGILNAHPGILPYYRGIDCASWAIYNDELHKIGASVNWVDSGVDTGNIIITQCYDFQENETIETLQIGLYNLCVSLLTNVVSKVSKGNIIIGKAQNISEGKQYYKMPRKLGKIVINKLSSPNR